MSTTRPPYDVPTISFDALPRLTSWQRSRLVRSTRKVAKILGEAPVPEITFSSPGSRNNSRDIIQECPRSHIIRLTKKLARTAFEPIQGVLRRDSDSDGEGGRSTNFEPACVNTSSHGRDRSPVLFFEAPNLAPVDPRACRTSQVSFNSQSPTGPSFRRRRLSLTSSSSSELFLSPTEWEEYEEARSRRKRLSKLTRYLGESIPADLILPNMTSSKPKSDTRIFTPPVVPNPSTVSSDSVAPPFSSTRLSSPMSKSPNPAVVGTVDSFVGSIGLSRFNADATCPRPLARRLPALSRSDSTLSLSHEHLTLLRPDTPVLEDIGSLVPPSRLEPLGFLRPLPGTPRRF